MHVSLWNQKERQPTSFKHKVENSSWTFMLSLMLHVIVAYLNLNV